MSKVDEDRVRRIEELVRRIELIPDPDSRESASQLMQAILELHGAGLERMMEIAFEAGSSGEALIRKFTSDNLVASLLVLHNLHPDDLETRVRQTLAKLPGHIELLSVFEDRVRVRVSSGNTRESVEAALRNALPDAAEIIVEESLHLNGFVPLSMLGTLSSSTG